MKKSKSYMKIDNVLSEGFFDKLLEPFIPKDMKDKIRKSYIDKLEKEKKESDKKLDQIVKDLEKAMNKRFPDRVKKKIKTGVK
jgi:response regulator of citrate/malate metabolism